MTTVVEPTRTTPASASSPADPKPLTNGKQSPAILIALWAFVVIPFVLPTMPTVRAFVSVYVIAPVTFAASVLTSLLACVSV